MSAPIITYSTTSRHALLIQQLTRSYLNNYEKENENTSREIFSSTIALVHAGTKKFPPAIKLLDANDFDIYPDLDLEYVEPDVFIFHYNPYVQNKKQTRTLGQPDLIIEIWSDNNTEADRDLKKFLYSSSPITETWYIEQSSNVIEAYLGEKRLPDLNMEEILITQSNIKIDLQRLSL